MSKKDKAMIDKLFPEMPEELRKILEETAGPEKMEQLKKRFEAQRKIGAILEGLGSNEALNCIIPILSGVVSHHADSLDEALSIMTKVQMAAIEVLQMADEAGVASWNNDDDEEEDDDFPVEHKTKQ